MTLSPTQNHLQDEGYARLLPSPSYLTLLKNAYGLDIDAVFLSPPPLGGDIWDIKPLPDGRVVIFAADISGHGSHIAPITKWVHGLMHEQIDIDPDPSSLLVAVNNALYQSLPRGQFSTLFYGVIDRDNDRLEYACAASMPQLLRPHDKTKTIALKGEGLPLGFVENATYETLHFPFHKGGTLTLYSDAVVETPFGPEAVFSPESLTVFVNDLGPESKPSIINHEIMRALDLKTNTFKDDLTLVSIRRI